MLARAIGAAALVLMLSAVGTGVSDGPAAHARAMTDEEKRHFGYPATWDGWLTTNPEGLEALRSAEDVTLIFYADGWQHVNLTLMEVITPMVSGAGSAPGGHYRYAGDQWQITHYGNVIGYGSGEHTYRLRAFMESGWGIPPGTIAVVRVESTAPDPLSIELTPFGLVMEQIGQEACVAYHRARFPRGWPDGFPICSTATPPAHVTIVRPPEPWPDLLIDELGLDGCRRYVREEFTPWLPHITESFCGS